MPKVKVITDSTADLPLEVVKRYGIIVLPMVTSFSGIDYRDGVDLKPPEFYKLLADCSELPHTSQHSPQFLAKAYQQALADGSEVIALHLSSGLSGTVQNARLAQEMVNGKTRLAILDSLSASMGQGLLATRAAELAENGFSLQEIVTEIEMMRQKLCSIFMVDTLKYLLKGGRINKVQATVGSLLDIKPVLHINSEGKIDQLDKVRGRRAALRRLISLIEEQGTDLAGQTVGISHAICQLDAERVRDTFKERFGAKEVIIGEIGAVIGTHVGHGTLAIFFQGKPK